jgi:hypothetical protein
MALDNIHPKVKAPTSVGVPAVLVVEIFKAFGVDLPADAVTPALALLMILAGYLAPNPEAYGS